VRIGCLGWGSLIWIPGELRLAGDWRADGPALPIEFSRVADGGELATAICLGAATVDVLWAPLITNSRQGLPEQGARTDPYRIPAVFCRAPRMVIQPGCAFVEARPSTSCEWFLHPRAGEYNA